MVFAAAKRSYTTVAGEGLVGLPVFDAAEIAGQVFSGANVSGIRRDRQGD